MHRKFIALFNLLWQITMTSLEDLPPAAVRLITRAARSRIIPGTNRFARVCRSWRDADLDSDDQEQLQLLLALEGLPADTVASTSEWMEQHGECVTSLDITYTPATAALYQHLPLSTAPLASLARLEVDGPDSLVALAPALPQLVALTHLRAGVDLFGLDCGPYEVAQGVFSVGRMLLAAVPSLQQLCPGLKSLRLDIVNRQRQLVEAPVAQLLPDRLEQLCIDKGVSHDWVVIDCASLTRFTSLRCLALTTMCVVDPDQLLLMPGLEEVDLRHTRIRVGGQLLCVEQWLANGLCAARQHLNKLTGLSTTLSQVVGPLGAAAAITSSCGLRRLKVCLHAAGAAVCVQQLSALTGLQDLSLTLLSPLKDHAAAVLSGLAGAPQLTSLHVSTRSAADMGRTTWAWLLPRFTQLRVLGVEQDMLDAGLAAEVYRLGQLQCLYVADPYRATGHPGDTCAALAHHLPALGKCSSLRAVLCWSPHLNGASRCLWAHVHEGRLHLSCWRKWGHAAEEGRVVCPRPCPHLPGVWELQQQEAGDG
jgi:hypothetical protein